MFGKHRSGYFIFKGIPCYQYGILAEKLPPITRAAKRVETVNIPGANGTYHIDEGAYNNIALTVECAVLDEKYINNIGAWLQGYGKVIFGNEPEFYRYAMVYDAISFEELYRKIRTHPFRFPVVFDCNPIKYHVNEVDDTLSITSSGHTFRGKGTVSAKPIITVYGSGTITLTVNSTAITLTSVSDYITINSTIMDAYKGSANANLQMSGSFPTLNGNGAINTIKYSGTVTKIEITPQWGWI